MFEINKPVKNPGQMELIIERTFNAPIELMFRVWTEHEHLKNWWGPKGFEWVQSKMNFQPGGAFHYCMRSPNGMEMWGKFIYGEIFVPNKIEFRSCFSDENGGITRNPWISNWPLEVNNILTFKEQDGKTSITLRGGPINATPEEQQIFLNGTEYMRNGFKATFEQLDDYLMKISDKETIQKKDNEFTITRYFDASREQVWKAWTEPEQMMKWWGPKTFTSPSCKIDLRAGGKYLFCMRASDGKDYWSSGTYREIVSERKLLFTDNFADEKGNTVPASYYGFKEEFQQDLNVTVTLENQKNGTKMILKHAGMPAGEMSNLAILGWNESFDKLEKSLKSANRKSLIPGLEIVTESGKQEIIITRIFNAPVKHVFETATNPNLIPEWWGPKRLDTTVEMFDLKTGGIWRYVQQDNKGKAYGFHGVYHEIVPNERIVQTFEFEGMPGHVVLETSTFEDLNGKTIWTSRDVFQSVEDRDGMLQSDMEEGIKESIERFSKLLKK